MSQAKRSPLEVLERKRSILQEHIDNAEHRVASLEVARRSVLCTLKEKYHVFAAQVDNHPDLPVEAYVLAQKQQAFERLRDKAKKERDRLNADMEEIMSEIAKLKPAPDLDTNELSPLGLDYKCGDQYEEEDESAVAFMFNDSQDIPRVTRSDISTLIGLVECGVKFLRCEKSHNDQEHYILTTWMKDPRVELEEGQSSVFYAPMPSFILGTGSLCWLRGQERVYRVDSLLRAAALQTMRLGDLAAAFFRNYPDNVTLRLQTEDSEGVYSRVQMPTLGWLRLGKTKRAQSIRDVIVAHLAWAEAGAVLEVTVKSQLPFNEDEPLAIARWLAVDPDGERQYATTNPWVAVSVVNDMVNTPIVPGRESRLLATVRGFLDNKMPIRDAVHICLELARDDVEEPDEPNNGGPV